MKSASLLARVMRGGRRESVHRGDVAVVDEEGALLASAGDPDRFIYLRSAAKPFQAMPLLAAGGERAFGLDNDEIALMCASHGGEPRHVRVARQLLARGGFHVEDLVCGAHLPMHEPSALALVSRGSKPTALHNNCSGKHAGILLACRLKEFDTVGYANPSHPIQREILDRLGGLCGVPRERVGLAVDGCSLPVFYMPLAGLALGYARLMARHNVGEDARDRSVRRTIRRAMCESPQMVAGLQRFTTDFLEAGRGRWIGKEGAEGVYAIGLSPSRPAGRAVGIAFKMEDGSSRARDAVTLAILDQLGRLPAEAAKRLCSHRSPAVRNVAGLEVGRIEPLVSLTMHHNPPRSERESSNTGS